MRESDRLNSLLNDFILTVDSRQSNTVRVSLSDLVQETVGRFTQQLCAPRGIGVESKISSNLDVVGQPHRLRQAVWNLLANAAEASPDSSRVRVVLQPDGDQAVLTVQDSGPGIPHELRDKIFEPFSTTKEFGTGLGLPLILSTVEAHNGTIEVQSGVDQGAVFVIRLPLGSRDVTPKPGELNDV
jgi:two-component system sensor histidine kinase PilS (NtrC family)